MIATYEQVETVMIYRQTKITLCTLVRYTTPPPVVHKKDSNTDMMFV